jgi:ABC-2 type transport system permease protein
MRKIWLLATTTYRRRVRSGMFLILTFGLPVLMIIAGGIAILRETGGSLEPIGYVDQTARLAHVTEVSVEGEQLTLTGYPDTDAASAAFQQGEIVGYLVIPPGYFDGEPARFFAEEEPSARLEEGLAAFMRRAMLPGEPEWVLERLASPARVTYVARDSGIEIVEGPALLVRLAFPAVLAAIFALAVLTSSGQMGAAVVREKDQRAMEMIVTSLAPRELVAGKVLGMTMLSLTQVGVWVLGAGIALVLVVSGSIDVENLVIPWEAAVWALLLGVPAYFLYAVLAAGLGIIAGDTQQAQQLAGVLGFLGLAPLWFLGILIQDPGGSLAVALTLFPLTAPEVGLLRMALGGVPIWQLLTSLLIILLSLGGSIWLVSRIFRSAMLLYGKALRPRQLWDALRTA